MNKSEPDYEKNAVALFRSSNTAILSTLSKSTNNYPFGSFATFASNSHRELFIYASDIAEHTKNILNDSRACVTIFSVKGTGDKQASERLSIIGDLVKVCKEDIETSLARFYKFLPESESYSRIHGFHLYKLEIVKVRWIGGFGQIRWLDTKDWISPIPKWQKNETAMIEHMNQDHSNVIGSALKGVFDINDAKAKMMALCIDGYYILSSNIQYFIPFHEPCYTEKSVREALIIQAKLYRMHELF